MRYSISLLMFEQFLKPKSSVCSFDVTTTDIDFAYKCIPKQQIRKNLGDHINRAQLTPNSKALEIVSFSPFQLGTS